MFAGKVTRLRSTFVRPADATQYTAGDEISNSATAASVVRATFNFAGFKRGRLLAAGMDITPASGNVVVTANNIELLIFKTADVPAAVGDNVTHPITGAVRSKAIASFLFDDGAWKNPLGAFTASTSAIQEVPATLSLPLATPALVLDPTGGFFEFLQGEAETFTAVVQVVAAWNPGNVANTIGITLHAEVYPA